MKEKLTDQQRQILREFVAHSSLGSMARLPDTAPSNRSGQRQLRRRMQMILPQTVTDIDLGND